MTAAAPVYATREAWLVAAVEALRGTFDEIGRPLPAKLRVTCGWPSQGGTGRKRRRIGECWKPEVSADGTTEVFIAPTLAEPLEVFPVLLHECIHASGIWDHRGKFIGTMKRLGLAGKPTATVAGEDFATRYGPTLEALGAYPHARMTPAEKAASEKQTTRMLKCECGRCGYVVRTTRKWAKVGMPSCVCGAGPMVCRDPIEIEGDEPAEAGCSVAEDGTRTTLYTDGTWRMSSPDGVEVKGSGPILGEEGEG